MVFDSVFDWGVYDLPFHPRRKISQFHSYVTLSLPWEICKRHLIDLIPLTQTQGRPRDMKQNIGLLSEWAYLVLPLYLCVECVEVLDQLFFLAVLSEHRGHVFPKRRDDVRMDLKHSSQALKHSANHDVYSVFAHISFCFRVFAVLCAVFKAWKLAH